MGVVPEDQAASGTAAPARRFRPTSEETLVEQVVSRYLEEIADDPSVSLSEVRDELLSRINGEFTLETKARKSAGSSSGPLTKARFLDELSVVRVLLARRRIVAVSLSGGRSQDDLTQLGMYCDFGPDEGLYTTGEAAMVRLASEVRPSLTANAIESLLKRLKAHAPVVAREQSPELVPLNNGIFDHGRQELLPFSPDHVFLVKSPVDYDATALNPVITHPVDGSVWDVESWIRELSDDVGVPELLWEVIGAALRPGVRWNKAVFLHSSRGNNGKGTFCALLRELLGPSGSASIPIANFGKPFALSELVHARAIITDENSVGAFSKDLGDFKSVVTGDAFTLDRKYKDPVSLSFSGLVVQCVNDFPKSRDKSASYTRRQLFIPFAKWFGGAERGYIKSDYLRRPEVLRYVLRRALEGTHAEFSNPVACQELLDQFQRENNPVRDFWSEFEEQFVWDLLPTAFLYDLFLSWFRRTHPSGQATSRNEFAGQLRDILRDDRYWLYEDLQKKHRPGQRMKDPEPLIAEFDLKDWKNPSYTGSDPMRLGMGFPLRTNYIGVLRRDVPLALPAAAGSDVEAEEASQDEIESTDEQ